MNRRAFFILALSSTIVGGAFVGPAAQAQTYPSQSIKLVVPYPAGGGTDFFARTIGAKLSEQLGTTVVI